MDLEELKDRIRTWLVQVGVTDITDDLIVQIADIALNGVKDLSTADEDTMLKSLFYDAGSDAKGLEIASKTPGQVSPSDPNPLELSAILYPIYSRLSTSIQTNAIAPFGEAGNFNKAFDNKVKSSGLVDAAQQNMRDHRSDVEEAWIRMVENTDNEEIRSMKPGEWLEKFYNPDSNGNDTFLLTDISFANLLRESLAAQGLLPDDPSEDWMKEFNKNVERFKNAKLSLSAKKAVLNDALKALTPEQIIAGQDAQLRTEMAELEALLTNPSKIASEIAKGVPTEEMIVAKQTAEDQANLLAKPEGREQFMRQQAIDKGLLGPDSSDAAIKQFNDAVAQMEKGLSLGGDMQTLIDEAFSGFLDEGKLAARLDITAPPGIPRSQIDPRTGNIILNPDILGLGDKQREIKTKFDKDLAELEQFQQDTRRPLLDRAKEINARIAAGVGVEEQATLTTELGVLNDALIRMDTRFKNEVETLTEESRGQLATADEILEAGDPIEAIADKAMAASSIGPAEEVRLPSGQRAFKSTIGPTLSAEEISQLEAEIQAAQIEGTPFADMQTELDAANLAISQQAALDAARTQARTDMETLATGPQPFIPDAPGENLGPNTTFSPGPLSAKGMADKAADDAAVASAKAAGTYDPTTTGSRSYEENPDYQEEPPIPQVAPPIPEPEAIKTPEEIERRRLEIERAAPSSLGTVVR
jgi:hypothetical protein